MSEANTLRTIDQITEEEFRGASHIRLYPMVEDFVVAQIGNTHYAVSYMYAYAYTRKQLIEKYSNVGATFLTTERRE